MRRAHEFHQVFGASAVLAELGQTGAPLALRPDGTRHVSCADEVIKIIGASSGTTASTARHALMRFVRGGDCDSS